MGKASTIKVGEYYRNTYMDILKVIRISRGRVLCLSDCDATSETECRKHKLCRWRISENRNTHMFCLSLDYKGLVPKCKVSKLEGMFALGE